MTTKDKDVLRRLASEYMEAASLPAHEEKLALWKALNRGKMTRPMVMIDQLPWNEIAAAGETDCFCENGFWRRVEWGLRAKLYQLRHFPVDLVPEPYIGIPKAAGDRAVQGIRIDEDTIRQAEGGISSHRYRCVLNDFDDLEKIVPQDIYHDEEETERRRAEANEIFGGIAPVRMTGHQFHLGAWDKLSTWMGVERIYMDLMDRPDFMLAAITKLTDSIVAGIERANELKVHAPEATIAHCSHIFTDELLPGFETENEAVSKNCWSFGLAQLFSSVSPDITRDFELPFITRMAEYFGMIYYGCCDRLDDRLDLVKRIPGVKKVSCSPWSVRERFAEEIGPELVMSVKPNPAYLAGDGFDGDAVEADLRDFCNLAKRHGINMEFILKDVSTVRGKPGRIDEWAKAAMRAVESF